MRFPGSHRLRNLVKSVLRPATEPALPLGLDPAHIPSPPSGPVLNSVRRMRGDRPPVIMLHGALGRTGTNYLWALLGLHPDLSGVQEVYEFSFLSRVGEMLSMQRKFEAEARAPGTGSPSDFVALFSTAILTHLYERVPQGKRLMLKMPAVSFLNYFPFAFPHEQLLLLNRDGRDVVTSWRQSWPHFTFEQVCRDWHRAVRLMLAFQQRMAGTFTFDLIRYEDAVREPAKMARRLCERFGLDVERYPFEQIGDIPVRGSSAIRDAQQEEWQWKQVQKPADFDPIGRWKTWTAVEKRTFKRIAGQSLIDCGYTENLDW